MSLGRTRLVLLTATALSSVLGEKIMLLASSIHDNSYPLYLEVDSNSKIEQVKETIFKEIYPGEKLDKKTIHKVIQVFQVYDKGGESPKLSNNSILSGIKNRDQITYHSLIDATAVDKWAQDKAKRQTKNIYLTVNVPFDNTNYKEEVEANKQIKLTLDLNEKEMTVDRLKEQIIAFDENQDGNSKIRDYMNRENMDFNLLPYGEEKTVTGKTSECFATLKPEWDGTLNMIMNKNAKDCYRQGQEIQAQSSKKEWVWAKILEPAGDGSYFIFTKTKDGWKKVSKPVASKRLRPTPHVSYQAASSEISNSSEFERKKRRLADDDTPMSPSEITLHRRRLACGVRTSPVLAALTEEIHEARCNDRTSRR